MNSRDNIVSNWVGTECAVKKEIRKNKIHQQKSLHMYEEEAKQKKNSGNYTFGTNGNELKIIRTKCNTE